MMGLLESGDATMLVKYTTKMTAAATTRRSPSCQAAVWRGGQRHALSPDADQRWLSLFYDPDGYAGLSRRRSITSAACYNTARPLLALTNPAPTRSGDWSRLRGAGEPLFLLGNRSAAVRIPKYAKSPISQRFEFARPTRPVVYLALTAQLMAAWTASRARSILPSRFAL